jgi:hypothetical protein
MKSYEEIVNYLAEERCKLALRGFTLRSIVSSDAICYIYDKQESQLRFDVNALTEVKIMELMK